MEDVTLIAEDLLVLLLDDESGKAVVDDTRLPRVLAGTLDRIRAAKPMKPATAIEKLDRRPSPDATRTKAENRKTADRTGLTRPRPYRDDSAWRRQSPTRAPSSGSARASTTPPPRSEPCCSTRSR